MNKIIINSVLILFILMSCSFDYGEADSPENTTPDLVMQNVEYVRVRSADPVARIQAERVERYEKQGQMTLENFTFEQFTDGGETVNITGSAGYASVEIESGDIIMNEGVWLEVDSEDIVIETNRVSWSEKERVMFSGEEDEVNIFQEDGTIITGIGLRADARRRTWEFAGAVRGTYYHEE